MPAQKREPSTQAPTEPPWVAEAIRDLPPICKLPEVARVTRFSVRHLRRYIDAGQLRTLRATTGGSSRLLVARAEVGRFLAGMVQP
ncbi:MAG TPA: hypothetical protein VHC69_12725 [Polyangiaceae bacterium]|nr:hypothetical protein [Polyangiaceae bacterium]